MMRLSAGVKQDCFADDGEVRLTHLLSLSFLGSAFGVHAPTVICNFLQL